MFTSQVYKMLLFLTETVLCCFPVYVVSFKYLERPTTYLLVRNLSENFKWLVLNLSTRILFIINVDVFKLLCIVLSLHQTRQAETIRKLLCRDQGIAQWIIFVSTPNSDLWEILPLIADIIKKGDTPKNIFKIFNIT